MEIISIGEIIEKRKLMEFCLNNPERVLRIPCELYDEFERTIIFEKRFEDLKKLFLLEFKKTHITLKQILYEGDFIDGCH